MALTAEGRSLTEAHRLAQVDLADETIRDVTTAWKALLDPRRIEESFPAYFETSLAVLDRDHFRSSALSSAYLEAFHEAEGFGTRPLDLRTASGLAEEQALRSLFFTGPAQVRTGVSKFGLTVEASADKALPKTLKAAKRLSLQGGRVTITDTVQATGSIEGVARVTDGDPCHFCAMLAGRGAVYKSEETAGFEPHDGCGCQPEPVYATGSNYKLPGRGQDFQDLYREIPGGLSAADSRRAFRGLYERGAVPDKYLRD